MKNNIYKGWKIIYNMKRVKPEVYSRVVGYLRPVQQWNEGKQAEFKDRTNFLKQGLRSAD